MDEPSTSRQAKRQALSSIENLDILDIGDGIDFLVEQQNVEPNTMTIDPQNVEQKMSKPQNVEPKKSNKCHLIKKSTKLGIQTPTVIAQAPLEERDPQVQIVEPNLMPTQPDDVQIEFVTEQAAQNIQNSVPFQILKNYDDQPTTSLENQTATKRLNFEERRKMPIAGKQFIETVIVEVKLKIFFLPGHKTAVSLNDFCEKPTQIVANDENQFGYLTQGQNSGLTNNASLLMIKREQDLAAMKSRESFERLQIEKQRLELETKRAELENKRYDMLQAAFDRNLKN